MKHFCILKHFSSNRPKRRTNLGVNLLAQAWAIEGLLRLRSTVLRLEVGYLLPSQQVMFVDCETVDNKETFGIQYDTRYDPESNTLVDVETSKNHDIIWQHTRHLPGFRETAISFWQARLVLARKLVRIFALALDLSEDYFDAITTHPGSDALYIHYPPSPRPSASDQDIDVGIGSHTDIQLFTLLWQDFSGGLQVLSNTDEWLDARPIQGTLVVNVGDFLQRLSNDRFRSTVHRVYNRTQESRYSMPFFFGFNADAVCKVVPTCVREGEQVKYEPISCGEVSQVYFHSVKCELTMECSGEDSGLRWLRSQARRPSVIAGCTGSIRYVILGDGGIVLRFRWKLIRVHVFPFCLFFERCILQSLQAAMSRVYIRNYYINPLHLTLSSSHYLLFAEWLRS